VGEWWETVGAILPMYNISLFELSQWIPPIQEIYPNKKLMEKSKNIKIKYKLIEVIK
jgi:hypothetical protein